jgi:phage shock protein PspC (stress-responsive transcriptional regulator)
MEKIININFQGRVIPIEETAYNKLKEYIDSLRSHFASEESSDEIINDIENRIAELLSDRLKRGSPCIVSTDINSVIDSIGRLEDIEAAEAEENTGPKTSYSQPQANDAAGRGRFTRNDSDKVIAGVCSGIANRTGVDPVVIRILFVLLCGALFWLYIILWIIVPAQSMPVKITRRLYRNPDDKMIGGVCGGLAAYLHIESWIPRLIFALPLVFGIISGGMHTMWWHHGWGFGPRLFTGSFGSTLLIAYIILWIVVPYASSASDKMEMRGEKVDMNTIKAATQAKGSTGAQAPVRSGGGAGRIIGILFKAFFFFIAGVMAISLLGVLIGLLFGGIAILPFAGFFLGGWEQFTLGWIGIILLIGIPPLAIITWIIRRLTGVRTRRHYLGYVFGSLWVIGLISAITLTAWLAGSFSSKSVVEEAVATSQPAAGKLYINVNDNRAFKSGYHYKWPGDWNDDDAPFYPFNGDSLHLNTVKVNIAPAADSLFHIYKIRISRGNTSEQARSLASHIYFNIGQQDSIISLPKGFAISNKDKFRNQQVVVMIEVPVGKKIEFNENINRYDWFNIHVNRGRNYYYHHRWPTHYRSHTEYVMTPSGLKDTTDSTIIDSGDDDDDD